MAVYADMPAAPAARQQMLSKSERETVLPAEFGRILESFQGSTGVPVILVQDAHAIPDAQKSIQRLIDYFQKKQGLEWVAVEGAASELDTGFFRSFPDKVLLKKTVDQYLDRGELAGSTAAALLNEKYSVFRGIENWTLYEKGLGLYQQASGRQREILEKSAVHSAKLEKKKREFYSKDLLSLDRALRRFESGRGDLSAVLRKLARVKRPAQGTELEAVLEEMERSETEQSAAEAEVRGIAETLESGVQRLAFSVEKKKAWNQQYQAFQTGQVSSRSFALDLKSFLEENPDLLTLNARRSTLNALSRLSGRQKTLRDIEGTEFFKSFETYAQAVKAGLITTETQRELDRESHRLELLEKLAKLELTRRDWEEVKKMEFLPSDMNAHSAFYENAEQRDQVFFKNLMGLMNGAERHSAMLVAGGFHTEGLTQQLRARGVSYLLIAPQMTSLPGESCYKNLMRGEVSWKNYYRVENGKVDLYAAFARALRDQLLNRRSSHVASHRRELVSDERRATSDESLVKRWRDQIIRDGVNRKQISKISQYTSFIDEIITDRHKPEWQIKAGKIVSGLRRLEAAGQLTKQNVAGLLRTSTMGASVSVGLAHDRLQARYFYGNVLLSQTGERRLPPFSANSEVRTAEEVDVPRPPFADKEEFLVAFGIAKEKLGKDFTPQQIAAEIGYSSYKTLYKLLKKYGEADPQVFMKSQGAKVRLSQKPMSQGFGDGDQERFLTAYDAARVKLGEGYTPEQMAKELGYARAQSLRNRIRRYGFEPRSFMQERGSKVQRNWTEFVRDYEAKWRELGDGYSLDAMAKALGYKNESGLRTQITDAGHSVREFAESRGADLRKKEHEGGRLAFVRQMDKHYKVLGPDAIAEEYAARMGYENMNSFNSALRRYKVNFRVFIRSKGDSDVPMSTREVAGLHAGPENFLRNMDGVLLRLPRNPEVRDIVREMKYRNLKYFLKRIRDMGHDQPRLFIAARSAWVHDRHDFEIRVSKAVDALANESHPLPPMQRFLKLTRVLGFAQPFEFLVTVHQLQADLTKAGFSSALLRQADTLAWFSDHFPQNEAGQLLWLRTLLRLEAAGTLEPKMIHALLLVIKNRQPVLSRGQLEELEKLFHVDLVDLFGSVFFSEEDRKADVMDFLVSTGNQKREFELATGLSNPKPILSLIEKYMPAYFAATGRQGEIPLRTPLTREFLLWLRDTGALRDNLKDQTGYADVNRLATLLLFLPEDLPKFPENFPPSVSAQQELLKQYFSGDEIHVPGARNWIKGPPGALELFRIALQNPEASDLIENLEFSVQKEALALNAESFSLGDLLQRWGTAEDSDALLTFLRHLEAAGYQSPDKNISEIARWLQREITAPEHGTPGQVMNRKLVEVIERMLPQGMLLSRLMNAIALSVIHTEHLLPRSALSEVFLSLVQFWKKRAAASHEMQTAFNSWLLDFASLARSQPDNQELQGLYEKIITSVYPGIQIARPGKEKLAAGPRRVRFVLQTQKFNIPEIKKRYDEHRRRQLQQQTMMARMRGAERVEIEEWNGYVMQYIYKNYGGLLRSGVTKPEILNAAVHALSKMAYDYGYEDNVFDYLLRALRPEKNPAANEAIRGEINERFEQIQRDIEKAQRLLETAGENAKAKLRYESQIGKREVERRLAEAALEMQVKVMEDAPVEDLLSRIAGLQQEFDRISQQQGFMSYFKWELSFLWREHKKTLNLDKPVRTQSLDAGKESAVLYEMLEDSSEGDPSDRMDRADELAEKSGVYEGLSGEVLSDLEREVLRLYYSKDPVYTYANIAYQLAFEGVTDTVLTRERVHQIAEGAIGKIKESSLAKAVQSWNDFIELLGSPRNRLPNPLPLAWPKESPKYVMIGSFIPLASSSALAGQDVFIRLESFDTDVMTLSFLEKIRSGVQPDHAVQHLTEDLPVTDEEKKSRPQFMRIKLKDGRVRLLNLNEVDWKPSEERTYMHSLIISIRSREGKMLGVQEVQLLTKPDGSIHPLYVSSLSDKGSASEEGSLQTDPLRSEMRDTKKNAPEDVPLDSLAEIEEELLIEMLKPQIDAGWETEEQIRYSLAVHHAIRKDIEGKEVRAAYGGADDDVLHFLLITNAVRGVFLERAYARKDYNWHGTPFEPVDAAFLTKMIEEHWEDIEQFKYPWTAQRIIRKLKTLGIEKKDIYITESDLGESEIHFVWKHPDDQEERIRSIVLKHADLRQPQKYEKVLSEGMDIYLQIASEYLASGANYLTPIAQSLSDGGFLITNNFVMGHGEFISPSEYLAAAGTFSNSGDFETPEMQRTFQKLKAELQKALHVDVRKKLSSRSEVRKAAYALVSQLKSGLPVGDTEAAAGVIVSSLPGFIEEVEKAAAEMALEESIERENQLAGFLAAMESAEPVYIDYVVSEIEIRQWKGSVQTRLQRILSAARTVNIKSRGKMMTRLIVPESAKGKLKPPADMHAEDPVRIDIGGREAKVYNPDYSGSPKLGLEPATITVTNELSSGRLLLNDKLASGESLNYGPAPQDSDTAVSVYLSAVLAVTALPHQTAELLTQVDGAGTKVRQRIKDAAALSLMGALAGRLAEQFLAEFRLQASA